MVGINIRRVITVDSVDEKNKVIEKVHPTRMDISEKENLDKVKRNMRNLPNVRVTRGPIGAK